MTEQKFRCDDGIDLYYHVWKDVEKPRAVIHICHGMAEHSARYDHFARHLNSIGIVVYAQDHRGHGLTCEHSDGRFGYFAESDGWNRVVKDSLSLSHFIKKENPGIPFILMGHSMGSFMMRSMLIRESRLWDMGIVVGTGASMGIVSKVGHMIADMRIRKYGADHVDEFLNRMSFGSYNRHFGKTGSPVRWLSRDEKQVRLYEDDPWCGFVCTSSFYRDLIDGIEYANSRSNVMNIRKDIPILVISGSEDPVGKYSRGVKKVAATFRECGIKDVTLELVDKGRHEILNEIDRESVYSRICTWIEKRI